MEDLIWKGSDAAIVLPIGVAAVCFCAYWFIAHSSILAAWVDSNRGEGFFVRYGAFYQKTAGFLFLGVIPAVIAFLFLPGTWTAYGVGVANWPATLSWILFLGGGLSFIPWYSARQEEIHSFYPQVRAPEWTLRLLIINGLVWVFYLLAYEFLFRGFLLINLADALGWWPAIIITTAISTVAHIPKGGKETFGTIPLSIVLCLTVVHTGGIWTCVVAHAILAISNDYWALVYNPGMQLRPQRQLEQAKKTVSEGRR